VQTLEVGKDFDRLKNDWLQDSKYASKRYDYASNRYDGSAKATRLHLSLFFIRSRFGRF
jgi:hypothetical protein